MNASHAPASPEWLPFVNITEETIPGGAVVEPAGGYDTLGRIRVRKCTTDDSFAVYFNSPMAVAAGSPTLPDEEKPGGLCRTAWPLAAAAVHPDDLAGYAPRVASGTKSGDWYLRLGQSGFLFLDDLVDGVANAMPDPVAVAGGGRVEAFRVSAITPGGGIWEYTLVLQEPAPGGKLLQDAASGLTVTGYPAFPQSQTERDFVWVGDIVWARPRPGGAAWELIQPALLDSQAVGGLSRTTFSVTGSTGYPTTILPTGLGTINDSLRIRIGAGRRWGGNLRALVHYRCHYSLVVPAPAGAITDANRGWFVIRETGRPYGDIATVFWPTRLSASDGPSFASGVFSFYDTEFFSTGVSEITKSLTYSLFYFPVSGVVPTLPTIKLAVCTTAAVVGNSGSNYQDWLDESSRGTSPQPACPSVLTI